MIHDQQRHTLHLGRRDESQDCLASPMRPETHEQPALVGDLPSAVKYLKQPFVALRFRFGSTLGLFDNLPSIVLGVERRQKAKHRKRQR